MIKNKKILILIVAYNAEKTIKKLLERFPKETLDQVDEILLADDASTDQTKALADEYKKKNKTVSLILLDACRAAYLRIDVHSFHAEIVVMMVVHELYRFVIVLIHLISRAGYLVNCVSHTLRRLSS